ncbi:MAG TPA: hypothetical protein V6C65_29460 [Allocoleopsis sp.]
MNNDFSSVLLERVKRTNKAIERTLVMPQNIKEAINILTELRKRHGRLFGDEIDRVLVLLGKELWEL